MAAFERLLWLESEWLRWNKHDSAKSDSALINESLEIVEQARKFLLPQPLKTQSSCASMKVNKQSLAEKSIQACLPIQYSLLFTGNIGLAVTIC